MKVIHTSLKMCGAGIPTTYAVNIVDCRRGRTPGRWSGRHVEVVETFAFEGTYAESRKVCDAKSREVAARLGMPAGPDVFPYAD